MPIDSAVYTLTLGTAIQIVPADNMAQEVTIHNMTKSSNEYIHIGGPDVTVNNSIHIDPGQTISLTIRPSDSIWAVSDPGGLEVGVFRVLKRD